MAKKVALITGITGQDGSYLTEFLLEKGYEVHGIVRRSSLFNTDRIDNLFLDGADVTLHDGDMTDAVSLGVIINKCQPNEIYNLAAQSHVKVSFDVPEYTANADAIGHLRILEVARDYMERTGKEVRIYQAGTSEMFGAAKPPQSEETPFYPRSPYAVSKQAAHWYGINYREAYDMFISNGILFNHESPRRGETFVTRKITLAASRIKMGLQDKLYLGNLDAKRDWGFAGDYVKAMWMMLQHDTPDDFVVATGTCYSIKEFLELAFGHVDLNWEDYVEVDPKFFRPTEVEHLHGDPSKAKRILGWEPEVSLPELVTTMMDNDIKLAQQEKVLRDAGFDVTPKGAASGIDTRGTVAEKKSA